MIKSVKRVKNIYHVIYSTNNGRCYTAETLPETVKRFIADKENEHAIIGAWECWGYIERRILL